MSLRARARLMPATLLGAIFVIASSAGAGACTSSDGSSGDPPACPNDLPTCPAAPPSYAKEVAPVLQKACAPCHLPGGQQEGRLMNDYFDVNRQRSAILNQLHACRMPPVDAPTIPPEGRTVVLTWLECNAPNN